MTKDNITINKDTIINLSKILVAIATIIGLAYAGFTALVGKDGYLTTIEIERERQKETVKKAYKIIDLYTQYHNDPDKLVQEYDKIKDELLKEM